MNEIIFPLDGKRVWVAGHNGMVGAALMRRLTGEGCEILTVDRAQVDLRRQTETDNWISMARPDAIFLAAAKVGGIEANNNHPAGFLYDNLMIAANVIESAKNAGVGKVLFLGSSCVYPKFAPQPIREESLLTGDLEPTNQWYSVAKIAGIKLVEAYRREHGSDFIAVQPTNLYGPGDNFDPATSHVPAALVRRFHEAKISGLKEVVVWGTGAPRREFLEVNDLADACVFTMKHYSGDGILNIGSGEEISISDFARLVAETVGYQGEIVFDPSRPDGTPRKLLDGSRLAALGWRAKTELRQGLRNYYAAFLANPGGQCPTAIPG